MKELLSRRSTQGLAAVAAVAAVLLAPALAGADVISSAFTSEQTSITSYIGEGTAVIVAVMALGIGVRLLVKWVRRAVKAT
jgi:hypothetical protein